MKFDLVRLLKQIHLNETFNTTIDLCSPQLPRGFKCYFLSYIL